MKISVENTTQIIEIEINGAIVPARVWEGATESGIKVQCLVTRIAANRGENLEQFERELKETRVPSATVQAFPLRMIL